jgi:ABC-type Zn2+ transport system substrate-binding protein/surface adhesin
MLKAVSMKLAAMAAEPPVRLQQNACQFQRQLETQNSTIYEK